MSFRKSTLYFSGFPVLILMACGQSSQYVARKINLGSVSQCRENFITHFQDQIFESGPAGWMIEWYEMPHDYSVYVFCPGGTCNVSNNDFVSDGKWQLKGDTIWMSFEQHTSVSGKVKSLPQPSEEGSQPSTRDYEFYDKQSGYVIFKRVFDWRFMTDCIFTGKKYPFKLLSRDADC